MRLIRAYAIDEVASIGGRVPQRVRLNVVRARDYVALMKPRVMSLVVFTAIVGMVSAPGVVQPVTGLFAICCIAAGAGAAAVLNMWYDADIDAIMSRTADRPIPRGRVQPGQALAFGLALAAMSVILLGLATNVAAAALLAGTIGFYVLIYTAWLKRTTPQNIVIGGAAGALPPVIGWVAAAGTVNLEPLLLFLIIFVWTPPHFWALSLYRADDYARAGVPMLPIVAGKQKTRQQILVYTLVLVAVSLMPWVFGLAGRAYGAIAAAAGAHMMFLAWRLWTGHEGEGRAAVRLFFFSIVYLFAIFAAYLAEKVLKA